MLGFLRQPNLAVPSRQTKFTQPACANEQGFSLVGHTPPSCAVALRREESNSLRYIFSANLATNRTLFAWPKASG